MGGVLDEFLDQLGLAEQFRIAGYAVEDQLAESRSLLGVGLIKPAQQLQYLQLEIYIMADAKLLHLVVILTSS
ncbi:MAG: hypothetical protein RIS79_3786 [Verrucomicrobiota bacterium]